MSGASETAACPPSPVADDPSALRLPLPLPPPVSNCSCLFTRCQPLYATVLLKVLYHKIKNAFLIFVFVFHVLFVQK